MRTPLPFFDRNSVAAAPSRWAIAFLLFFCLTVVAQAQTIAEIEPNNTAADALAGNQDRIFQATNITGTVSSTDEDIWLVGYDEVIQPTDLMRLFLISGNDASLTIEYGNRDSHSYTGPIATASEWNALIPSETISSCAAGADWLTTLRGASGQYRTLIRITTSSATPVAYNLQFAGDIASCPFNVDYFTSCATPATPVLGGTTRTSSSTLRLNSFTAAADADGYIVQITDNGTFSALPDTYDQPLDITPSTTYSGSGDQVVAFLTTPAAVDVTGLSTATTYTFKVTPYKHCLSNYKKGAGVTSTPTPTCGVIPSAPSGMVTASPTPGTLSVQSIGEAPGGAQGYITYISDSPTGFTDPAAVPTPNATYSGTGTQAVYAGASLTPNQAINGITAGTTYYFRTYSYDICDGVTYVDPTGVSTSQVVCEGAPNAPTVLSLTGVSHSSVNVASISPVANANGYVVLINTTNSFTTPADGATLPGASTNYSGSGEQVVYAGTASTVNTTVTGLDNSNGGVTYYFKAFAFQNCEGNYYFESTGVAASVTTRGVVQVVASNAVFFEVGDAFMDLNNFTGAAGATGHVIKMNTTNSFTVPADGGASLPTASTAYAGGEQVVFAGTSSTPAIRITGLTAATTYHFAIYTYSDIDGALFYHPTAYEFSQLNVKPLPSITFSDFSGTYGDANFVTAASSNAAGGFTYTLESQTNGGTAVAANGTITVGNAGTAVIRVNQAPDANYNPGTATATLTINKADPLLQFSPLTVSSGAADQTLTAVSQVVGSAASASTGTISYSIEGSAPGGNLLSGTNNEIWTTGDAGSFTVRASITADANYNAGFTDALFTVAAPASTFYGNPNNLYSLTNGSHAVLLPISGAVGTNMTNFNIIGDKIWAGTNAGGANGKGALFTVNMDGSSPNVLVDFNGPIAAFPGVPTLVDGAVWITAFQGSGMLPYGEVYKIDPNDTDGSTFQTIHSFAATGLRFPGGSLVSYGGKLYGVAENHSDASKGGGVYSLTPDTGEPTGYRYTEELTMAADLRPYEGLVVHNDLLWFLTYDDSNGNEAIHAFNPANNTLAHSINQFDSNFRGRPLVVNDKLLMSTGRSIYEVNPALMGGTSRIVDIVITGSITPFGLGHTFDGNKLYGTGLITTNTPHDGVIYRIDPDGTNFEVLHTELDVEFRTWVLHSVSKLDPVITFTDQTVSHLSNTLLAASTNSSGTVSYALIGDLTGSAISGDQFTAGNVGTVTVRVSVAEDANYNAATKDVTFTIAKADPAFTIADVVLPFGSAVSTLAPSATNYLGGTIAYQFIDGMSLVSTGPNTGSTILGGQLTVANPGTEMIRATLPATTNFNERTVDFQLTVAAGVADLSGFSDFSVEFFQSDVTLNVPSATGLAVSYELLTSNTGSSLSGTNNEILSIGNVAGTETLRVTVTEPNYEATTKDITLTVNKAAPVLSWNTPADIQFNIEPLDTDRLNATASVAGTFEYYIGDAIAGTLITPGTTAMPSVGSFTLTAVFSPTDSDNYSTTQTTVSINATKINLTIEADDKVWITSGAEPALTYTITSGALYTAGVTDLIFLPLTRGTDNALGTYSITIDLSQTGPWLDEFTDEPLCAPGLCIVDGNATGVFQTARYNITFIPGTFTITDKPQISASDITFHPPASLTYDQTAKTYNFSVATLDPVLPASDIDLTYEGRNGTTYASSATAPTDGGDYTVTATVKASNLDYGGNVSTDFTITPANTTISLNLQATNPVYDGTPKSISPSANDLSSNPLTLVTEYSIAGVGAYGTTAPTNAGTYDVRVNLSTSETNYTAPQATGSFTIDKQPQSITFNPIPEVACGQTTLDLTPFATSSTGGAVSFASDNSMVVTISGSIATVVGAGTATITATQGGDANTAAAANQTQTLTIAAVQENFTVDNPGNVQVCNGGTYTLPTLTSGNYFSGPGGTGMAFSAGNQIASTTTLYVYGVSSVNASCTDENSFTITIESLPVDDLSDVVTVTTYTLPALTHGNYFTGSGGTGTPLSAGDIISSTQTIYIFNEDVALGCTAESSFLVDIPAAPALHFSGDLGNTYDYLEIADDNSLDFTTGMTFEAWVNFDQVDRANDGYDWEFLMGKNRHNVGFGLMLLTDPGFPKNLVFWHPGVGDGDTQYLWPSVAANTWYHIAVTVDGTSGTKTYVNGVQVASESGGGALVANANALRIGANGPTDNTTDPYPLQGAMDEVRFWNYARTEAQINSTKDTELAGTESGLVLYYNFSEGTINGDNTGLTQVTDRSAAGNNATFNSFALSGTNSNYTDGSGNGVLPGSPQSITFNALANVTFGDATFDLSATATSGLAVSYTSSNPAVATVAGNTVTIIGTGTTTITASQGGNAAYLAAADVDRTLTVDPFTTAISLNLPGTNPTYTGIGQGVTPTANNVSSSPTLAILTEYSVQGANSFSTTLPINAGTYDVRANLNASETNYTAAQVTGTYTIDKASLTATLDDVSIVYGTLGTNNHPTTYSGFVNGETESVLTFTTGWPQAFYVNGSAFYNVGGPYAGAVTWVGNPELHVRSDNYAITFIPGDLTAVTARPINITGNNRTLTYGADANTGSTVTFEANDDPGMRGLATGESEANFTGTVTFDNITLTDAGSHTGAIIPNGGLTNSNYSITYVPGNLTIDQAALTVKAQNLTREYGAANPTISTFEYTGFQNGDGTDGVTDLSGLAGLSGSASGTIAASADAMAAPGSTHAITVDVTALSSTNYTFAADNTGNLTISKANQLITFGTLTDKVFGDADFTLGATASSSLAVTYVSSDPAVATVSGNTVTVVGVGTTNITASQAGDVNFNAAADVVQSLTVNKASQTLTFGALANRAFGDAAFDLTATASSGLAVSYASSDASVATIAGSTVTITGVGTTNITASQVGDASYDAAPDVVQVLTVTHGTYERYFVKVHSLYGMTAANQPILVKTLTTAEGQNIEALLKVGNQIWGTASNGGANNTGTLFRMDPDGGNFEVLHDFTVSEGAPRNDMAMVSDATVYGIAGDYGIFRIDVTNPAAGLTFYNGYSGTGQFTSGLLFIRGNLWAVDDNTSLVGVQTDFAGHVLGSTNVLGDYGNIFGGMAIEGYQITQFFDVVVPEILGTWPSSAPSYIPSAEWLWSDNVNDSPQGISFPRVYKQKARALFANGQFFRTRTNLNNTTGYGLLISELSELHYPGSHNNVFNDPIAAFNGNVGTTPLASLSEPYLNIYEVKDSVVWGLRGDAATGLFEAFSYDLNTSGYQVHDFGSGNLEVGVPNAAFFSFSRVATLVTNDQTKAYGSPNPTYTYEIWGLDAGDDASTIGGVTTSSQVMRGAINLPVIEVDDNTHPGHYPIFAFADTLNGKYDLRHNFGALTITYDIQQTDLSFSPATASYTYDGSAKAITASGIGGTPAGPSSVSNLWDNTSLTTTDFDYTYSASTDGGMTYTVDLGTTAPSDAGKYRVTATVKSSNTVYSGSATFDFEIAPIAVTITPDANQSRIFDATDVAGDPALTYTFAPALLGSDVITGALTRAVGSDVGVYNIELGTLNAGGNYDLTLAAATFEITPLAITVTPDANQSRVFDGTDIAGDPTITYTHTSLLGADTFTGGLSRAAGANVNTYAIELGSLSAGANYTLSLVAETYEITPLAITVTPDANQSKVFDGQGVETDPAISYTNAPALIGADAFTGALSRVEGSDVNTYAVTQGTLALSSNYTLSLDAETFEITTLVVTVTPDPGQTKGYDAMGTSTDPTLTYQVSPALIGSDAFTGALTRAAGSDAGTYAIEMGNLATTGNYAISLAAETFEITPRLTFIISTVSKTYDGQGTITDPELSFTSSPDLLGSDTFTGALAREEGSDVGGYNVTIGTLSAGGNYNLVGFFGVGFGSFSITPLDITVTPDVGQSRAFDGTDVAGDPTITYTNTPLLGADTFTGALTRAAGTDANTYAIALGTLSAGSNYNLSLASETFEITPLTITVTPDANQSKIYDGQGTSTDPALTYSHTPALLGMDTFTGALTRLEGSDVNTYAIQQGTLTAGSNYSVSLAAETFEITTRAVTITPDAGQNKMYDAMGTSTDPTITYTHTPLLGGDTFTGALSRAAGSDAGTYAIEIGDLATTGNYSMTLDVETFEITPKPISIAVVSATKTYDGMGTATDPAIPFNSFPALLGSDVFSGALTRVEGSDVGTYTILPGTLTAGSNYNLMIAGTFVISSLPVTITPDPNQSKVYDGMGTTTDPVLTYTGSLLGSDTFSGVLTRAAGTDASTYAIALGTLSAGSNYNLSVEAETFEITPLAITVTPDANQSKVYDGQGIASDPALTYSHTPALLGSDTFSGSLTRVDGSDVNTYAIEQGTLSAGDNYALTLNAETFEISRKAITVTPLSTNKTYGDDDPASFSYTPVPALIDGDVFSGALTRVAGEDAGFYDILQGTLTAGANYDITYASGSFLHILARQLSITIDDQTKIVGASDPEFTYTITSGNLIGSDVLSGALTRDPGETLGDYVIQEGTLDGGSNYLLNFTDGTLTITDKIPQTITFGALSAVTYGDAAFDLTATGGASGNPVTYVSSNLSVATVSGSTVTIVGAGTTTITASQAGDATYAAASDVNQVLTVNQRALTVTADAGQTKVYGDADPSFTYTITSGSLVGMDALTGALDRVAGENVGTYAINQGTLANANYNVTFVSNDFEVSARAITITANPGQGKVFGDSDPVLIYQVTSGALQGMDVLSGTLSRAVGEDVGFYAINQGTVTNANYDITFVGNNFIIGNRILTVTADAGQTKVYGDTDPSFTYQLTSGALQGSDAFTGALDRATGESVGTYAIGIGTLTAGSNYSISFVAADFNVTARPLTITADAGQSKIYGASDPTLAYTITTGSLAGMDALTGALDRAAGENAGTYAINQGTLTAGTNYTLSYVGNDFTIDPVALAITADNQTKIVGAADPALAYTVTSGALVGSDMLTGALTRVAGETVGDYAIQQGTLDGGSNYAISFTDGTLTITDKTPQTITFGTLTAVTYGDADFSLNATGGASGNPVTYVSSDVSVATVSGSTVTIVGAGTTTITASQAGDATYAAAADVNQVLTVNQRALTVTADAGQTKGYGDADPTFTYAITSGSLVGSDVLSGTLDRVAGENVGNYAIGQGTLANANYAITLISNDFEISAREITVTADAQSKVYGDADPTFTYQVTSGALQGSDVLTGALTRVTGENVGTYTISQGTLANTNYQITFVGNDLNIGVRPLTITADAGQTKVYGAMDPTLTYQITSGALQGSDVITGALTRATGEDVGTYAIGIGTLTASNNYSISFVGADFEITKRPLTITADAGQSKTYGASDPTFAYTITSGSLVGMDALSGTLNRTVGESAGTYAIIQGTLTASSNYLVSFVSNDFTIDPIALSITADDKTKVQGTANPAFTYRITSGALINGDLLTGSLTVPPAAIGVGMYPIQQGTLTAGSNYAITFTDGTFTITDKLLQSITFDPLTAVTYGDGAFTVSATGGASGNPVTFTADNPSVATVTSTGEVTIVGAGTVNITANQAGDATYAAADPVIQNLTVNQAALTITAEDKSSTYGDASLPGLTLNYAGFVNSETESVLTTAPVINTTAMASSNAGAYPITVSGAIAANYAITHVDGTLTVDPAALTITADNKSTTYGDAIPGLTLSYAGFVNSEDQTVLTTAPTVATTATNSSNAGSYAISVSGAAGDNYAITEVAGTLTIGKANLSVTADDNSKSYGAANPSFNLSYAGFIGSDDASVLDTAPSGNSIADATSAVGTYAITASGGIDNNYTFSYTDGTLTVNQATLSVTADDQSKTYGAANPSLAVTYSGFQNGDDASALNTAPSVATTADATSPVGTYAITASGGVDDNYAFTYTDGTLTVNQATLSVTADDQSKTYGAANPSLAVTYSGFQNGDDASALNTAPSVATTADATSPVGTYAITASGGVDDNYAFTYTDGTLTVNQATLSVTADDQSRSYGAANPSLTLAYSGFQNGDDVTSLTTAPTASTSATSTSSVGTYAITVSGGVDDNYTFTYSDGTLTVNQATLSVTAANQSRTYGVANPNLTITYSGFQNGEDASYLTTEPTIATSAISTSNVGTYAITVSGGVADNYAFTYTDGTLTINQATLSVTATDQTITYGDAIPTLTFKYAGFQNGEDETVLDTAPTASTTATTTSDAGAYSITVSGGADNNYGFAYTDGTLTINKADQTITFNALADKTVGDAAFDLNATASSGLTVTYTSSDEAVATISGSTVTILTAGTTTITASQSGGTNFNAATDVAQTLTVNTNVQDQTITFEALDNQTYGASPIELAATASSGLAVTYISSDASVATVSGNTVTVHGVGTATITASQAGNENYTAAPDVAQTLTVDPAPLIVRADDKMKGYGDANPTLTLTYIGFVNGEDATVLATTPTVSTLADANSDVGSYEILVEGGSAANYSLTRASGNMTIVKSLLVITADDQLMRTGQSVPELTMSFEGFVNGDSEADLDILPSISTLATSSSASGQYAITLEGGEDNNYEYALVNGILEVETALGLVLEESQIMIYPNPVVDKLHIDFPKSLSGEEITVQLFDLEGRKLQSKVVQGYGIELDVKELPEGLLILQMSANGEVIRKRIRKD